jgi:hypothetical protein
MLKCYEIHFHRPNAKVPVMICRYTISLTCVLKTKDRLDDTIVLCIIRLLHLVYGIVLYEFPFPNWSIFSSVSKCAIFNLFIFSFSVYLLYCEFIRILSGDWDIVYVQG